MDKTDLTLKQKKVLEFIEEYQYENGSSPTLREIREHLQVSSDNSVLKHLKALKSKKYIEKDDTPRGIKLLESVKEKLDLANNLINLPILGEVSAGPTATEDEEVVGWYAIDSSLVSHAKDSFMLRVRGDSMIDVGIYDGDLVIADRTRTARHKDIVVALVDNENTVKRYVNKGGLICLKPENKDYRPIFPKNELYIQGVVTGLIRTYK